MAQSPHQIRTACHEPLGHINWVVQDYFQRGHNKMQDWRVHINLSVISLHDVVAIMDTSNPRG
jgi:hypothetical protein